MNHLRVELLRTKHSAAGYMPLVGLVLGLVAVAFSAAARLNGNLYLLLGWQALYVTGLAAPLMALLAGLVATRETAAREGGTLWRDVSRAATITARMIVLALLSFVFHVLCYGVIALVALTSGFPGAFATVSVIGAVSWAASLGLVIPAYALATGVGLLPTLVIALVWQVIGTMTAEEPWWALSPPAWAVRAMLPMLRVHANAVPLEPGAPLLSDSPVPAIAFGLTLAVLATGVTSRATMGRGRAALSSAGVFGRSGRAAARRSVRGGALGAIHLGIAHRGLGVLSCLGLVVLAAAAALYDSGAVAGFYTFAILPLGATLLAVIAWTALKDPWWTLMRTGRPVTRALIFRLTLHVAFLSALTVILLILARGPVPATSLATQFLLWVLTGSVMVLLALTLSIRYGVGVALATGLIWTVLALTIGGDVLAETPLWITALPAWAEAADTPARAGIATVISLVLLAILSATTRGALRRHVARA